MNPGPSVSKEEVSATSWKFCKIAWDISAHLAGKVSSVNKLEVNFF